MSKLSPSPEAINRLIRGEQLVMDNQSKQVLKLMYSQKKKLKRLHEENGMRPNAGIKQLAMSRNIQLKQSSSDITLLQRDIMALSKSRERLKVQDIKRNQNKNIFMTIDDDYVFSDNQNDRIQGQQNSINRSTNKTYFI